MLGPYAGAAAQVLAHSSQLLSKGPSRVLSSRTPAQQSRDPKFLDPGMSSLKEINEYCCKNGYPGSDRPPYGFQCGAQIGAGSYQSICPSADCINPWGDCLCYTKVIDDGLTGEWPAQGVAQQFEESLPQCNMSASGLISIPGFQHCDMNTPSRLVYRNNDLIPDY